MGVKILHTLKRFKFARVWRPGVLYAALMIALFEEGLLFSAPRLYPGTRVVFKSSLSPEIRLLSSSMRVLRALFVAHDWVKEKPCFLLAYLVSPTADTTPAGLLVPVTLKATPDGLVVLTSRPVEPIG